MTVLDIIILVFLGVMTWLGSSQRPIKQASVSLGASAGILFGAFAYTKLSFLANNSLGRTLVLSLLIIALGLLCYDLLLSFGSYIERKLHLRITTVPSKKQRLLSGSIACLSAFVIVWLTLGMLSATSLPILQKQAAESRIAAFANNTLHLPPIFITTANLLAPFSEPKAFAGAEPTFKSDSRVEQNFTHLDAAIQKATPSIYKVSAWGCGTNTTGSGFLVNQQTIVTNAHVIAGATRISVQNTGSASQIAEIIWFDPDLDLAILRVQAVVNGQPLELFDGTVSAGDIASAVGYSRGNDISDNDATVLQRFTAEGYNIYNNKTVTRSLYALRGNIVPGLSGSPLIGDNGKVLGLVFGHSTTQNHTGYALTSSQIAPGITAALARNAVVPSGSCAM